MENLFISPTTTTPEIRFSVEENIYSIKGISRPEDVRALYYPVVSWIKELTDNIENGSISLYSKENPLRFQVDLFYFNSSSAKFLCDIFSELKRIPDEDSCVLVEWYYEREDTDMYEAGKDIALIAEMEFIYFVKEQGE